MSPSSTESTTTPRPARPTDPAGRSGSDRDRESPSRASEAAERLARALRADALEAGHAVVVGDVAGVVEWTDAAWVRLTGFPLDETVGKPIGHFLDRAGLERELVGFVAQHFLDGRSCTVELPFDRSDGRRVDVRLEVEPCAEAEDGATRFVAVARAIGERPVSPAADAPPAPATEARAARADEDVGPASPAGADASRAAPIVDLNDGLRATIEGLRPRLAHDTLFETIPEPGALEVVCPPERLGALVDAMADGVDGSAPFVSALSGRLAPGRSHHSAVHPIPARATAQRARAGAFLELHDTGPHLDAAALARLASGRPSDDPRERAIDRARRLAEAVGAMWLLDSTPGCGTQQLLVFDAR